MEPLETGNGYHVVVFDMVRNSHTTMIISDEYKPTEVANWALKTYDTATDTPEGVGVLVYDGAEIKATAGDKTAVKLLKEYEGKHPTL